MSDCVSHFCSGNAEPEIPGLFPGSVHAYLRGYKILAYLKDRILDERSSKSKQDLKDAFNEVCAYALNTIEAYDKWVHNQSDVQVWERFYDLGRKDDYWAKEVINITHTREAKTNRVVYEKKISHFTIACFDANNIIKRNMRDLSPNTKIKSATVVASKAHDILLDYIKESTQGLSKMSINRIRRAIMEKVKWNARKAFENVASEQQ